MKTFLTILIIFALLVFAIFVLLRKSKNDEEVDDTPVEEEVVEEPAVPEDSEEEHAEPITESEFDDGKVVEEPDAVEGEEEISFQGCKDKEEKDINIPNKYFYHLHTYTTARGRSIFCIVCNAVIKDKIYKIIVNRSFYPYIISYTENVVSKIIERYTSDMTVEEFLKTGSTKYDRIGKPIDCDIIDNIN